MKKKISLFLIYLITKLDYLISRIKKPFFHETVNIVFGNSDRVSAKKVAIFAMWQSGNVEENTLETLRRLANNGWWILAVNNKSLNDVSLEKIKKCVNSYIERHPGKGRDISAFKAAYEHIINKLDPDILERVLFMNDSILVLHDRFESFLDRMSCDEAEVVGVTETTEVHYHLSSWMFCVKRNVFLSERFRGFWRRYKDLDSRRYSINEGEVGLSKLYSECSWTVKALYSAEFCAKKLACTSAKFDSILELLPRSVLRKLSEQDVVFCRGIDVTIDNLFLIFADRCNQTYLLQLICLVYLDYPFLKKDAIKSGVYEKFQIDRLVCRAMNEGLENVAKLLVQLKIY